MVRIIDERKIIKIFISCLGVVFALLLLLYFVSPNTLKPRLDEQGVLIKNRSEEDTLREANAKLLAEAAQHEPRPVPPLSDLDWVTGNRQAPVTLIVYYDFDDEFSARFHEVVKQAIAEYGGRLDVVWRLYPLASHSEARPAALAFMCGAEQGKAYDFAGRLFALKRLGAMTQANYQKIAEEQKLDMIKFNDCLTSRRYEDRLLEQIQTADQAGVTGAPHSFLNGKGLPGAWQYVDFYEPSGRPQEGLKTKIDKILKKL